VHTIGTGLTQAAGLVTVLPEEDRIRFARGMLDFANDEQEDPRRGAMPHAPEWQHDDTCASPVKEPEEPCNVEVAAAGFVSSK
jgi:hypothetical protein